MRSFVRTCKTPSNSPLTGGEPLHVPVLLREVLQGLSIKPDGIYIDGTFGRGGHSRAILAELGEKGRLLALDQDPEAIREAQTILDPRFKIFKARFSELENIVSSENLTGEIDGILLDVGVSSPQLDTPERGFSFMQDGPLDMRMDPTQGESVGEWLAQVEAKDLADVLFQYGEERYSRRIAGAIVAAQKEGLLTSTLALADVIAKAHPKWEKHKHPATRCFQALRIFINRELEELETCLVQSEVVLKTGGRLAVISFHSLEDRIVKNFGKKEVVIPRHAPLTNEQLSAYGPSFRSVGKARKASNPEVESNPRSRSATLRVLEKIK